MRFSLQKKADKIVGYKIALPKRKTNTVSKLDENSELELIFKKDKIIIKKKKEE